MGAGFSANRNRSSQDMWQNNEKNTNSTTNSTTNSSSILDSLRNMLQTNQQQQTGSTTATFAPGGQEILKSLSGGVAGGQKYTDQAGSAFGSMTGGGVSPYTEDIIKSSNAEADKNFAGRLAQTRAGAYRGGTATNIGKQGQLAADFSAQQGGTNAALRQGAYDTANVNKLGAASGLASLGVNQQGMGAQILSLLRGQTSTGSQVGTSTGQETGRETGSMSSTTLEQTVQKILEALKGGQSGTTSGTGGGVSLLKGA